MKNKSLNMFLAIALVIALIVSLFFAAYHHRLNSKLEKQVYKSFNHIKLDSLTYNSYESQDSGKIVITRTVSGDTVSLEMFAK